jgi:hypothetical protein
MHDNDNFNSHFDEWYFEKKKHNGHTSGPFHSRKHNNHSDSSSVNHWIDEAVGIVGGIVDAFRSRTPINGYERRRLDAHKKLVRRIERAERKVAGKKKAIVVFGILTILSIFSWELAPVLCFAGLTVYMAYSTHEAQKKLGQLHEEYHLLEQGDFPMAVTHDIERLIMQHAFKHEGKVYPEMFALESDLSLSQAEQILAVCVKKRLASIELDTDGRTYYYFARLDNSNPYASM